MEHIRGDSNNLADLFSRVLVDIGDDDETSIKGEIEVCPPVVLLGEAEIDIGSGSLLLCELPDDAPVPEELQRLYGRGRIEVREQSILYTGKKGRKPYYDPIMSRLKVLSIAHGDFHASTVRMIDDLTRSLWWPGMRQDATDYVQKCVRCARSAAVQACAHPRAALTEVIDYDKDSARLWEAVSLDHAGPFVVETSLEKSGRVYVLIMVDMRSGFCEMKKVHSVTSTATTDAFYESWASRYGWPKSVHCHNAPCFRSAATIAVWERYGAKVTFSPPFWPRANGVSEAIIKELKTVMSKTTPTTEAELELSCAGARSAHNMSRSDGLPSSPMEVALGYQPRTAAGSLCDFNDGEDPFKRLPPDQYAATVENYLSKKALLRERKRKAADDVAGRYRPNSFGVVRQNDLAFVVRRGSRRSGAIGPYRVTKIQGNRA
ncbi:retrovirus polyprotein, putative [Perkinsus marinus ATCC 50983]|uniref:Retrovirus polyprotein, putative n=1 Tax=Perkinsus marinus (strain ATCC 50983 / TXsc) TaxID=423536 RepID=C5LNB6_PERM5|nr:retrovirus polyprotein, putative [Perkinsus marinus ATCC 50983]EER01795.1 retrovirus polyprotein, putative [Perkinsus marinus ATCC 50983]|eukprot:XP_002769077.1 retrovirus polyprotein, putative [Perkinsus marinus ATCC 50983]